MGLLHLLGAEKGLILSESGSRMFQYVPMGSMGICESKHLLVFDAANTAKTCLYTLDIFGPFFFVYIVLTDVPRS